MSAKRQAGESRRRRLSPAERERQIVDGAVAFFAEAGIEGHTRDLAERLGVTQPLLYRYFPSKIELVERIYEEVYLKRWKPEWEVMITDRSLPIRERLVRFERDYQTVILTYDWLRIFVSAGLRGYDLPTRYLARVRERIFTPVLTELRREYKLPPPEEISLQETEFELLNAVHGALVYWGIRRFIYGIPVEMGPVEMFDSVIDTYLGGLPPVLARLVDDGRHPVPDSRPLPRRRRALNDR